MSHDRVDNAPEPAVTDVPSGPELVPAPEAALGAARANFAGSVGKLTAANIVALVCACITGPITARVLGVNGRGELAAILAVLTIAPWLLDVGLAQWVARERARGADRERLLGAALPVALGASMFAVMSAIPLSHLIGAGRPIVVTFLQIGLFAMPLAVALQTLSGLVLGEARWNLYAATRLVGSVLPVLVIVVLAVAGALTVVAAATAYLLANLLGSMLLLRTLRGVRRLSVSMHGSARAASFGAKCWLSQVAGTANNRLDQVLMAALVPSRELGLYAVAVTIASISYGLIQAVSAVLFPRVAEGDPDLAARACRVTSLVVAMAALLLAAITPFMLPFVFGTEFAEAVPMVLLLLAASVPLAAAVVLSAALVAVDEPGATMRAEFAGLIATIPLLVLLLPSFGGRGAAAVSLLANLVRLAVQLRAARTAFDKPATAFLIPRGEDVLWLRRRVQNRPVRSGPR